MKDVQVTPLGVEAAVISYTAEATRAGLDEGDDDVPFKALIGTVWRFEKETNRWLMCFHQQTPYTPLEDL